MSRVKPLITECFTCQHSLVFVATLFSPQLKLAVQQSANIRCFQDSAGEQHSPCLSLHEECGI